MIAALNTFLKFVGWTDMCIKQFKVQRKTYCSEESEPNETGVYRACPSSGAKKNERLSLLIQTICGTGIRISELEFITVEAINYGEAIVSCEGKSRKVFIVKTFVKNYKSMLKNTTLLRGQYLSRNRQTYKSMQYLARDESFM